jgi:hypothetical protein
MGVRVRDAGATLRTIKGLRVRDAGNVLRTIKTGQIRDAGAVLRRFYTSTTFAVTPLFENVYGSRAAPARPRLFRPRTC